MPPRGTAAAKRKRVNAVLESIPEEAGEPAASAGGQDDQMASALFGLLIFLWSWGYLSLPFVQKIAMAACTDLTNAKAAPYPDLTMLSRLGASGKHPNHMFKGLINNLEPPRLTPALSTPLPIKVSPHVVEDRTQSIFLPHVLFSDIYHKYPSVWKSRLAPSTEVIDEFWTAMDDHPLVRCTPIASRENYRQLCVPLRVHGDEVPATGVGKAWQKMFLILSWRLTTDETTRPSQSRAFVKPSLNLCTRL